jgi:hypothetical protein
VSAFIKPGKVVPCVHCGKPFKVSRKHFKLCSDECDRLRRIAKAIEWYHTHRRQKRVVPCVDPIQEAKLLIFCDRAAKKRPLFPITTKQLQAWLKKVR